MSHSMKRLVYMLLIFGMGSTTYAQVDKHLFSEVDDIIELGLVDNYSLLNTNADCWEDILNNHPHHISIDIPLNGEILTLNLREAHLFKPGFVLRTASGGLIDLEAASRSIYYQGKFDGYENSHFALSILNNEIIGVGNIEGIGDLNLGKLRAHDYYIFCPEKALPGFNNFLCETRGDYAPQPEIDEDSRELVEDCSSLYFEVDYDIYQDKGGSIEAGDYILALFNEIQLLYELDDMTVYISDMMIWDEESPYFGIADTGVLLDLFGTTTTEWEGDLGHFVSYSASGGLAWVNVFCSENQAIRKAVSGISASFEEVPVYSWSVEVISHELGHNMGSPHTHACAWNGDMTSIDGCGPNAGFDEGCEGDLPPDGGTVMSYCHLTEVGINLGLGFGEQPGELMRNNILESDCLESCDLTVMDIHVDDGGISDACDNAPISRKIIVTNKSNEAFVSCQISVYFDGVLEDSYPWVGYIAEEASGTISIPSFSKPLGTYTMTLVVDFPNGYEDNVPSDNDFSKTFDVHPFPDAAFLADPDQLVSLDATTTLYNHSVGAVSYSWNFGDGSPLVTEFSPEHTFPFEYGGNYNVELTATSQFGCASTATEDVYVEGVNVFYIPNSFVPESRNFKPIFSAGLDVYDYHFTVYNRWGEVMFESYNVGWGWTGNYGNIPAPVGVYAWTIEFGDLTSDEKHVVTGHVNLLR